MQDRAVRLREIAVARDTLQLPPGLATGMPIGADVAASEPAMIGAIRIGTEVRCVSTVRRRPRVKVMHRGWRTWRLGACIGSLLTGLAERFVEQPRKGFGFFGALASGLVRLEGGLGVWRGESSGHQTWMRRQINTRATKRSW